MTREIDTREQPMQIEKGRERGPDARSPEVAELHYAAGVDNRANTRGNQLAEELLESLPTV